MPKAHVLRALDAGKHTYCEKPLAANRDEGAMLLAAAAKQLRVGCAPDTFLGAGIQTARKLIDDSAIGRPVSFTAVMIGRGHEHWHPSPEFYYQPVLAEMAAAICAGRPHRCSAEQAFAVLDLMQGFDDSSATGRAVEQQMKYERPSP